MTQHRSTSQPVFGFAGGGGWDLRHHLRQPHLARHRRFDDGKRRQPTPPAVLAAAVFVIFFVAIFLAFPASQGSIENLDTEREDQMSVDMNTEQHSSVSETGTAHNPLHRDSRHDESYGNNDQVKENDVSSREHVLRPMSKKDQVLDTGASVDHERAGENDEFYVSKGRAGILYNEGGRKELVLYGKEYEASLLNATSDAVKDIDPNDEYDDGLHEQDYFENNLLSDDEDSQQVDHDSILKIENENSSGKQKSPSQIGRKGLRQNDHGKILGLAKKPAMKKSKRRKSYDSACEMMFMNSTEQLVEPLMNKKFSRFLLQFTEAEERPVGLENWEPRFAGHQTLSEREQSFYAQDQRINCGFVKGPGGSSAGFDISEDDWKYMNNCHTAVSSCIFGNSDRLRSPFGKTISSLSKKNVCFAMFLDEESLQTLLSEGQALSSDGFIGLWKVILVKNLPYNDMRRVGKIPKLLAHRLFPNARYSIWLDSKLRLQKDPLLMLEYFLWRHGYEYAISNHYDRHCVWEEVAQNKKLNKYNHTIIDQQFEFYQSDGLEKFDPLDPDKLIPSCTYPDALLLFLCCEFYDSFVTTDVPEGSFIVREHTPMSNLFSCLWYNEVERFTPRDQLSFAYTFLKLTRTNPGKRLYLNMFKDCERRAIAKLFHHRAEEKHTADSQPTR